MCDVPSIAVFCKESIECVPGIACRFFFKLCVTIPVAPIITGVIVHFRFHIIIIIIIIVVVVVVDVEMMMMMMLIFSFRSQYTIFQPAHLSAHSLLQTHAAHQYSSIFSSRTYKCIRYT